MQCRTKLLATLAVSGQSRPSNEKFASHSSLGSRFGGGVARRLRQRKKTGGRLGPPGDEAPPAFLVGPASIALTNFDGFSAKVVSTTSAAAEARAYSGEVIARQGRLIFQPFSTAKIKKGKIVRGGMFFIWDAARQRGYVLSEALQGYAPIAPPSQITIVTPENMAQPPAEPVNGHPCHRSGKRLVLRDGSTAELTEWRADDLKGFPVRVRVESGGQVVTADFSEVRLEVPGMELFAPPGGFTEYASGTALINELMIRESTMKQGPSGGSTPGEQPANFRQPVMGR